MRAIANMFHQLQETINSELDSITSIVREEEKDTINNINLNTAAMISEIKLLIRKDIYMTQFCRRQANF